MRILTRGSHKSIAIGLDASFAGEWEHILVVLAAAGVNGRFTAGSLGGEGFGELWMVERILLVGSRGEHGVCGLDVPGGLQERRGIRLGRVGLDGIVFDGI